MHLKLHKHQSWDRPRWLSAVVAAAVAFTVFAALVILTWPFAADYRRIEVELARESEVEELKEMPAEPEEVPTAELSEACEVELSETTLSESVIPSMEAMVPAAAVKVPDLSPPLPAQAAVMQIKSPVRMKTLATSGRSAAGRMQSLKRFGGNSEVEAAVLRGLRWIKRRQQADGSWRARGEGDATAFALLAFLAHGETFNSSEFGPTVKAAVEYLLTHHGNNFAVYALTEAAAIIRTPVLSEAAAEALRDFCLRQKPTLKANTGGIIQKYAAVMTLVSAQMAKLEIPELESVRNTYTRAFLEMRDAKAPDFKRIRGSGTWHFMVGGVCLQYLRHGEDAETRQMLKRLDELWVPATLGKTKIACCPVRSNYFSTMIFFNAGGELWQKWNAGMLEAYLTAQVAEGDGGYWRCQDEHIGDQPFWTTCYIVHQLMIYYRYLPTYTAEAWSQAKPAPTQEWHDPKAIEVEVDL